MKVINLQAENIKKLVAIEIEPTGNIVKISGANGAGKTSVLDAIWWALAGQQNIQDKPIREGQEKARIRLDLGDMVIERRFTASGSTLTVENKDGARYKSPQALLDDLYGKLSFDPLEFMRQPGPAQHKTLQALLGLDLTAINEMRARQYDARTAVNREIKALEARLDAQKVPPGASDVEIDPADLIQKINAGMQHNQLCAEHEREAKALQDQVDETNLQIQRLQIQLKRLGELLIDQVRELESAKTENQTAQPVDIATMQAELATVGEKNKAAQSLKNYRAIESDLAARKQVAQDFSASLEAIDIEKSALMLAAKFPVPGLEFGDSGVLLNGIPLDQVSAAEKLKVSVAMAMALNPKLKVIRVTDASLLDKSSMKIIEQLAAEHDYQVWMEIVDESGKVGVVIEDGRVAGVNAV